MRRLPAARRGIVAPRRELRSREVRLREVRLPAATSHASYVIRSPARIGISSRFSGGASGHDQRGSNAHDG